MKTKIAIFTAALSLVVVSCKKRFDNDMSALMNYKIETAFDEMTNISDQAITGNMVYYKVGEKVLIRKDGILRKAESIWKIEPWTITTVHTNGTIRIQCGTKSERINIRRVTPFSEELLI